MKQKAYFVGIKGVGMTALALAMQDSGWEIIGSDTSEVFITDSILSSRNIKIYPLQAPLPNELDLVVYSGAYNVTHKTAKIISLAEALSEFVANRQVVAVAGVGGKTTTSAMLATMFRASGKDVGYYIGTSDVVGLPCPGASGADPIFIVEADEYAISKTDTRPKFALLHPKVLITTNIIHDHPDIYKDEEATLFVFRNLIASLPASSVWIANEKDLLTQKILNTTNITCKVLKYSVSSPIISKFSLSVFGEHNKLNAAAAVMAGISLGLDEEQAITAIKSYKGSKRRQEKVGEVAGRLLYDDYGHHPHEIRSTINSFKKEYPNRKLVLVFESHTYSRTEKLLPEFAASVALADKVYLMPIFESAREKGMSHMITPELFVEEVKKYNPSVHALSWENAAEIIAKESQVNDLILTMGAGFVYKLHEQITWILNKI